MGEGQSPARASEESCGEGIILRDVFPSAQGGSNSVRYFAASFPAFFLKTAWAVWSSFGGGVVRCSRLMPTALKNSSCPAGEHRHTNRAGRPVKLWNWCGALAGILTVSPARKDDF